MKYLATAAAIFFAAASGAAIASKKVPCPLIYAPVCATTVDGQQRTFPNPCVARALEAKIIHTGKCDYDSSQERRPAALYKHC